MQDYCTLYNDWLDTQTYFWVETLVSSSSEQQWANTVTVEATDSVADSLAEKVVVCKATRAYAHAMKKPLASVKVEEVAKSSLGIKGYAELYANMPQDIHASFPKMDGSNNPSFTKTGNAAVADGKAKRARKQAGDQQGAGSEPGQDQAPDPTEPNPKKSKKDQTGPKKEKEVKEFLAMEQSSDVAIGRVMAEMSKNPDGWTWATDLIATYKKYRTEVLKLYCDVEGFQSLKVAALSSKESAKLKKELGDSYVGKLVEFITLAGPQIQKMAEAAFAIEKMASAKLQATENMKSSAAKPKAKAKGKNGLRRSASSKSLPSV